MAAKTIVFSITLLALLFSGCSQQEEPTKQTTSPQIACINLCSSLKNSQDFTKGPCIANPLPSFEDWVCDIAHSPREAVDDLPENQCSSFRAGQAKHFVELNENCEFIKQY